MKINGVELADNQCHIMGILNVTPDSFSDGGKWNHLDKALYHIEEMIKDGAEILDIGGESTKPGYQRIGYQRISEDEEIERVVPYIEVVRRCFDIPVSVDTYKAKVAKEAVKAGAGMINDIWGLKADKQMAEVVANYHIPCCLMHNRNLQKNPYQNLMEDVIQDLQKSIDIGLNAGILKEHIILDPGIGFGKTLEDNLKVMNQLEKLQELGCRVLLGTSRKSMIGLTLDLPIEERLEGTIATTVMGVMKGAFLLRVHDVKENYRAMKMTESILKAV